MHNDTYRNTLTVIVILLCTINAFGQQKSVLFLGNSYTYTGDLPGTLYDLALAGGDTIYHESNTPGGQTFEGHSTNATSLNKIRSRNWDLVVLQEQSQIPSFPPSQVQNQCYPFAEVLVDSIRSNYECTEPLFFMTWGRRDGDAQNCQFYEPLCTYDGMQARLRESYLELAEDNSATVSPCGAAWKQLEIADSLLWRSLFSSDGSHPSSKGTYLNACIFYATIFRESPVGLNFYGSVAQSEAELLQQLAEDVVLDSLDSWSIGHSDVQANVNHSQSGLTVLFSNSSVNATEHYWDFGDGTSSIETEPQHDYAAASNYSVSYIGSSSCDSDTIQFNVNFSPFSSIESQMSDFVQIEYGINDLYLRNDQNLSLDLELFDLSGRMVNSSTGSAESRISLNVGLNAGIYLLSVSSEGKKHVFKILVN